MALEGVWFAFALTLFAGLATAVGGALAFWDRATSPRFLALSLGFSAGVMVYVSFVEILPKGIDALTLVIGELSAWRLGVGAFFVGFLVAGIIDRLIPSHDHNHATHAIPRDERKKRVLLRTGLFTALAIAIHNFPEGLATFMGALQDPALGVAIGIAIAIHNIPEGIAVSIPIYHATGSKRKAFLYSFLSGLAEPVGALVGFAVFSWFFNDLTFGILFTAVAGIMVYISIDELLPAAHEHGDYHVAIYGFAAGMFVMALSLLLLFIA
jgi:ZIP family zinc transporter